MYRRSFDWSIGDCRWRCGAKSTAPNATNKQKQTNNNIIIHNTTARLVVQHWAIVCNVRRFYISFFTFPNPITMKSFFIFFSCFFIYRFFFLFFATCIPRKIVFLYNFFILFNRFYAFSDFFFVLIFIFVNLIQKYQNNIFIKATKNIFLHLDLIFLSALSIRLLF